MEDEKDISEFWVPKFEGDKVKISDLVDREIVILDFEARPSEYQQGKDYVLVQIEREGRKEVFTTTAAAIVGSLKWLGQRNAFPGRVRAKITQEVSTTGRKQYKLVSASSTPVEKIEE